jgi:hypothetical protein
LLPSPSEESSRKKFVVERRFRVRLDELLDDTVVEPAVLRGMLPRLKRFCCPRHFSPGRDVTLELVEVDCSVDRFE